MAHTLSIPEVSEILGLSYNRVYDLVKHGILEAYRTRSKWHIYPESVNAYKKRTQPGTVTEINGERVFLAWEFAQEIGLPFTTYQAYISRGKLKVIKMHSRNYITETERKRFLDRDKIIMGKRVVSLDKAAEITGRSARWVAGKIKKGEIEAIADGIKYHVFLDSLKKLVAREKKRQSSSNDKAFLSIPGNGKKRVSPDVKGSEER